MKKKMEKSIAKTKKGLHETNDPDGKGGRNQDLDQGLSEFLF